MSIVDPAFPARLRRLRCERGLSLRQLAGLAYVAKSHLHGIEAGTRIPRPELVTRLDDALAADGALAGLVAADSPLGYAAGGGRIDAAGVDQLADLLATARRIEDETGAGAVLPTVLATLDTIGTLTRDTTGPVRSALVSVAAQWAQFAGWLHLALSRWSRADGWLDRALEWSAEAGDRDLAATVLSFKGHRAWLLGAAGPLVGLTEAALRGRDVWVGQRAYDRYQLARGLAMAGDRRAAGESLAAGADLVAEALECPGPWPPWHYYRTAAFFRLEHGLVAALLGDRSGAETLIGEGLAGLPAGQRSAEWTGQYRAALSPGR